jgi:branched-chain amino acid transport system ATP-binding protein
VLSIKGITVYYGRVRALENVSLHVEDGEVVTLIGANGAGKSSLLNSIAGVVKPRMGRVSWQDQTISGLNAHEIVRQGIAYIPEGRQILSAMSVMDNLLLGAFSKATGNWRYLFGPASGFRKDGQVQESLERVFTLFPRLKEREKQRAGNMSGGEQQMLAIGRALMSSPKILLLDEPSIGLAPGLVREIMAMLQKLREQGLTILLVEQDAVAALKIADRGYVMERGRIVLEGPSAELLANDGIRHAYLGKIVGEDPLEKVPAAC